MGAVWGDSGMALPDDWSCVAEGAAMKPGGPWGPGITARVLVVVVGLAGVLTSARAEPPHDHETALVAVDRGEVLPLSAILEKVRGKLGGEVVGVSFERKHGRWVYEFRVIAPAGRLLERQVDAATAEVIARGDR